jgi:hypothetical protein
MAFRIGVFIAASGLSTRETPNPSDAAVGGLKRMTKANTVSSHSMEYDPSEDPLLPNRSRSSSTLLLFAPISE